MLKEALDILERIALEKNLDPGKLQNALKDALVSATRKTLGPNVEISECELDPDTGEYKVYAMKEVVETVTDPDREIAYEEACEDIPDIEIGEELAVDITPEDFGRIAAQSAKQVLTQRIREAEREMIYDKYKNRLGEIVSGVVQRHERGNVVVDLGNTEAILPYKLQPYGERYRYGETIKAIIHEVPDIHNEVKSRRDAQIILSRTDPQLVIRLFEQEVAEMREGVVTIRVIAREPGRRTKIAVMSRDSDVDPVGACVGMKGSRVQMVVQELRGERIDIIEYSDDKRRFVANSLKPAEIESVELNNHETRALIVVQDDALSLAIGRNGLNARLASELTGIEIDILSESQLAEREEKAKTALLSQMPSLNEDMADRLLSRGIINTEDVLKTGKAGLKLIDGFDDDLAQTVLDQAQQNKKSTPASETTDDEIEDTELDINSPEDQDSDDESEETSVEESTETETDTRDAEDDDDSSAQRD